MIRFYGWRQLIRLSALLLIVVLLGACGGDDDGGTLRNERSDNNDSSSVSSGNVETVQADAVDIDLAGNRLLVTHGRKIEIRDLVNPPIVFGADVAPPTVTVFPDQITYAAGTGRYQYFSVDLMTYQPQSLIRVSGQYAFATGFSPDGEWVLIDNPPDGYYLATTDGSGDRRKVASWPGGTALWLSDGTVLVVELDVPPGLFSVPPDAQIESVSVYDPSIQESTELGQDVVNLVTQYGLANLTNPFGNPSNAFDLAALLNELLPAPLLGTEGVIFPDEGIVVPVQITENGFLFGFATPVFCAEWVLNRFFPDGTSAMLYTAPETLFLNAPVVLPDGSIAFERWYLENCDTASRHAELLMIRPDGDIQVITDEIDPGDSQNYSFFFGDTGPRTNMSPDGRYIAWIGGGLDAGYSTLNLYDVAQNVNIELERVLRDASNYATFHLDAAFQAVAWLPTS